MAMQPTAYRSVNGPDQVEENRQFEEAQTIYQASPKSSNSGLEETHVRPALTAPHETDGHDALILCAKSAH